MPKPEIDYASYGIPPGAVILNELHVVEYMDPDDSEIYKKDISASGDGSELTFDKAWSLIGYAQSHTHAEFYAASIHDYVHEEEDEDE